MHTKQAVVLELYQGTALLSSGVVPKNHYSSELTSIQTPLAYGAAGLPFQFKLSAICRAQSSFHFSVASLTPDDVDADSLLNRVDFIPRRNQLKPPSNINLDLGFW